MEIKKKLLTILLVSLSLIGFSQGDQIEIQTRKDAVQTQKALLHLPDDYYTSSSSKRYPLMVFFPGIGEGVGNDLSLIYNHSVAGGPAYEIAQGHNMTFTNPFNGKVEKYIVVSVQSTETNGTTSAQVPFILRHLIEMYPKIDVGRIILTCISQGGHPTSEYAGGTNGTPAYPVAAYIPMSAALTAWMSQSQANYMFTNGTAIWGFGGKSSPTYSPPNTWDTHGANTGTLVWWYNQYDPNDNGRMTEYINDPPHWGWNRFFTPTYKETVNGTQMNIYEWGLTKGTPTVIPETPTCTGVRRYFSSLQSWGLYVNGKTYTHNPGDTLVLRVSDNWVGKGLELENIHGTPQCPIVIINEGGVVQMGAIKLKHCRYVKVTGSGAAGQQYGFYFTSASGSGAAMAIEGRSKVIEVERTNTYKETYMAWVKSEALDACPDSMRYPNWYIDSISYHDNKGFNIGQDALYFGSTSPNGQRGVLCNGTVIYPIPLRLSNIKIYNNIIDSVNRTAIQLSGADQGTNEIYNNTINKVGYELNQTQGAGIISGGTTTARIYNNYIRQTFNSGITIWGAGLNVVEGNDIDSSGYLGNVFNAQNQPSAILVNTYVTSPVQVNMTVEIKDNTLGRVATLDGKQIVVLSAQDTYNNDNVICGNLDKGGAAADVYVAPDITYTTCAVDGPNILPVANAGIATQISLPQTSLQLNGTGTDQDGTIVTYSWSKISGGNYNLSSTSIPNPSLSLLEKGKYTFRLTVTDNDGGTHSDDISIEVLPHRVRKRFIFRR